MKKFLIALPSFRGSKGFCCPTILVSAINKDEAISLAMYLRPHSYIGDIKEVDY